MNAIRSIRKIFVPENRVKHDVDPAVAYDIWAETYDNQPHNLMLHLDEQVFSELLLGIDLYEKHVIDVGCGTGRHWKKILSQKPSRLQGFDVSANMLRSLKEKFPSAETIHTNDELLEPVVSSSGDVIISTLTIAHVSDIATMFEAWKRVLKPGGEILLTDFHPVVLANGGKRNFNVNGNKIEIENRVHTIERITQIAMSLELTLVAFQERMIDETVKHFYSSQNALSVYDRYQGQPIIYGMHLRN